jgi:antirestriction protein ArdC
MTTSTRPSSQDRLAAIHAQLVTAVEQLVDGDAWRRMLQLAARFPTYSANNVLLIAIQKPDATHVCGLRMWNSLGRRVRKGEKGIAILAPCLYRKRDDTPEQKQPTKEADEAGRKAARELRGFRVVHVFDYSQTEGQPLPDVSPGELRGAAPDQMWERLVALAEVDGFTVERGPCGGAYGLTDFRARTVRVRDDVDPAQAVKSLTHEVGYIRAEHETRFLDRYHDSIACRGLAEVEAESIAYLVTAQAGLPTDDYSVPYVANWSNSDTARRPAPVQRPVAVAVAAAVAAYVVRGADVGGHPVGVGERPVAGRLAVVRRRAGPDRDAVHRAGVAHPRRRRRPRPRRGGGRDAGRGRRGAPRAGADPGPPQ